MFFKSYIVLFIRGKPNTKISCSFFSTLYNIAFSIGKLVARFQPNYPEVRLLQHPLLSNSRESGWLARLIVKRIYTAWKDAMGGGQRKNVSNKTAVPMVTMWKKIYSWWCNVSTVFFNLLFLNQLLRFYYSLYHSFSTFIACFNNFYYYSKWLPVFLCN